MKSILNNMQNESPLLGIAPLAMKANGGKKMLSAAVILTPLVDAFAILVIYLLVQSMDASSIKQDDKNINLPSATQVATLDDSFVVKIKAGQYFVNDKKMNQRALIAAMSSYKKNFKVKDKVAKLTIIADKKSKYDVINPIMEWSSAAGIGEIQLAVLKEGRS